jgi:cell division septal protein FtsQ
LRLLLIAAGIVVLISLAVGLLYSPLLNVRHLRITAPASIPRQELLAIAGLSHPRPLIDIDTGKVAARLNAIPTLGAARVSRHWPATLNIAVVARTPIAAMPRSVSAGALAVTPATNAPGWVTVDATGRVLADVVAAPGLPVVQGTGEVPAPGGWLEGSAGPHAIPPASGGANSLADLRATPDAPSVPSGAAAALAVVAALPPTLRAQVLSVTVAAGNQLRMAVLPATVASGAVLVNLGDGSQLAAKLTALAAMLAQANLSGVAQIDLTVPDRPATLTAR